MRTDLYYCAMKKTKSRSDWRKKLLLGLGITLVVLVGLGIFVNQVAINNDHARFVATEQQKDIIASRLVASLGDNVVSTRKQNECFNAEQGPFDHGKLWCQVGTVVLLKKDLEYENIGEKYIAIGKSLNLATYFTHDTFPSYTINVAGMNCQLENQTTHGDHKGSAMRIPFTTSDKAAMSITCSSRAMATYYTYSRD